MRALLPISFLHLLVLTTLGLPGCSGGGDDPLIDTGVEGGPEFTAFDAKVVASDAAAGNLFGWSVSLAGDTLVAGAVLGTPCPVDLDDASSCPQSGAAYVYGRDVGGGGAWGEVDKLSASAGGPAPAEDDLFGSSVALAGDRLAVGAPLAGGTGAVWIFERDAGAPLVWSFTTDLSGQNAGEEFGLSVAIDGDTLAVGAPGAASGGGVRIYVRDPGPPVVWNELPALAGQVAGERFGFSVALAGDTLAVGAPDAGGSGVVRIYARQVGDFVFVKELAPGAGAPGDRFGEAVALEASTLVVGAPRADDRCPNTFRDCDVGRGHVFGRDEGGADAWGEVAVLQPVSVERFARMGRAVALADPTIALGAFGDSQAGSSAGAVQLFARTGGSWSPSQKVIPEDAEPRDLFGAAVALDAGSLAVGAFREDEACPPDPDCVVDCEVIPPSCNPGAAYLFELE